MANENELDWRDIDHFTPSEFREGVIANMAPDFIKDLDGFRDELGCRVFTSPLVGGWVRDYGNSTSRHYIGSGRKSDAGDIFPECDPFYALLVAVKRGFGGIGLYFDTRYNGKPQWMMHLDKRPLDRGVPVIWVRDLNGTYQTVSPRPGLDVFKIIAEAKGDL